MTKNHPVRDYSLFRSRPWMESWLDTWRDDPRLKLIDAGGRGRPEEMWYLTRQRLKRILPIGTLTPVGSPSAAFSAPRSEYNDITDRAGDDSRMRAYWRSLKSARWSQLYLPDLRADCLDEVAHLCRVAHLTPHVIRREHTYAIENTTFEAFRQTLSRSTHTRFFQHRNKLARRGHVQTRAFSAEELPEFLEIHDGFHRSRWGEPCYANRSRAFIQAFVRRLPEHGGRVILEAQTLDGEAISTLFDVEWQGTRYNLQIGFRDSALPGLSPGSLHLGNAIEQALTRGLNYDLLAGTGKTADYKAKLANTRHTLVTLSCQKTALRCLQSAYDLSKRLVAK